MKFRQAKSTRPKFSDKAMTDLQQRTRTAGRFTGSRRRSAL
jgi:hypothetical protein